MTISRSKLVATTTLVAASLFIGGASAHARGPAKTSIWGRLATGLTLLEYGLEFWDGFQRGYQQGSGFVPPVGPQATQRPWEPNYATQPVQISRWLHPQTQQVFEIRVMGPHVLITTTRPWAGRALIGTGFRNGNVIDFQAIGSPNGPFAAGSLRLIQQNYAPDWIEGKFFQLNQLGLWEPSFEIVAHRIP